MITLSDNREDFEDIARVGSEALRAMPAVGKERRARASEIKRAKTAGVEEAVEPKSLNLDPLESIVAFRFYEDAISFLLVESSGVFVPGRTSSRDRALYTKRTRIASMEVFKSQTVLLVKFPREKTEATLKVLNTEYANQVRAALPPIRAVTHRVVRAQTAEDTQSRVSGMFTSIVDSLGGGAPVDKRL